MTENPKPIRVLHVYRTYFPDTQGGGEEVIRQVCHNTQPLGIESRVFTLSPSPSPVPLAREEAQVTQVKRHLEIASCSISLSAMAAFRQQAAWADVLHYHFPWPLGDVLHLLNRDVTSKPTLISYHSDVVRQKMLFALYRPLMWKFLARVDAVVATSPNYVRNSSLLRQLGDKVRVIPIGINERELPTVDPQRVGEIQRQFGDNFCFFVGVLRYYKGLTHLLEAAKLTGVTIVIAGAGPEEKALKQIKEEQGLDHVHFVGRISDEDKMAYLAACRALVFPSHLPSEAFGISLVEAAIVGKPMISCEIGTGTTYVNVHGETGLVIPPADAPALAQAMDTVAGDGELAKALGQGARQRYEELFTGELMGRQFADLYRELLSAGA